VAKSEPRPPENGTNWLFGCFFLVSKPAQLSDTLGNQFRTHEFERADAGRNGTSDAAKDKQKEELFNDAVLVARGLEAVRRALPFPWYASLLLAPRVRRDRPAHVAASAGTSGRDHR